MNTQKHTPKLAVASLVVILLPFVIGIAAAVLVKGFSAKGSHDIAGVMAFVAAAALLAGTPLSALLAVIALKRIRKPGGALVGKKTAVAALVLSCLAVVLIALAIPLFMGARRSAERNACISVLAVIESAKTRIAVLDRLSDSEEVPIEKLAANIENGTNSFICPSRGKNTYTVGKVGESPHCSVHGSLKALRDRSD